MPRTRTKFIATIGLKILIVAGSLIGGGCMPTFPLPHYEPQTATVPFNVTPDVMYQRAYKAVALMGGHILSHDPVQRILSAEIHNAVMMNVIVESTNITITGEIMPNKLVTGKFTEVQELKHLLEEK